MLWNLILQEYAGDEFLARLIKAQLSMPSRYDQLRRLPPRTIAVSFLIRKIKEEKIQEIESLLLNAGRYHMLSDNISDPMVALAKARERYVGRATQLLAPLLSDQEDASVENNN
jgi:hypothetical protein